MDAAPLIKAHDHARAASIATHTADTTVAINEHALAAGEFSNAAGSTGSVEAMRTLKLLEQHHKRLSEILQRPSEQTSAPFNPESNVAEPDEKQQASHEALGSGKEAEFEAPAATSTSSPMKPLPTLSQPRRYPGRDLSSSIASNLASARGIRSNYRAQGQPVSPSVSNDQAPGSLESPIRRGGSHKPSRAAPSQTASSKRGARPSGPTVKSVSSEPVSLAQSDDGFFRFYSTFGNIINRLSAPLAFAGLPLINEEEDSTTQKKARSGTSATASAELDLSKLYSKATLRILAKDIRGPNDSFYVVPSTGGTVSYANILSFHQKEKRRMATSMHSGDPAGSPNDIEDDDDDFVGARESQRGSAVSAALRKRVGSGVGRKDAYTPRDLENVIEELLTENKSLKEMLDKLSQRLHAFELNSQSSHLALAQSLRLHRPGSPLSSSGGGGGVGGQATVDEMLKRRNLELEEQLLTQKAQMMKLRQHNSRLETTIDKYRGRWDALKASAKARRDGKPTSGSGGEAA